MKILSISIKMDKFHSLLKRKSNQLETQMLRKTPRMMSTANLMMMGLMMIYLKLQIKQLKSKNRMHLEHKISNIIQIQTQNKKQLIKQKRRRRGLMPETKGLQKQLVLKIMKIILGLKIIKNCW